jgi:hypothetical protein
MISASGVFDFYDHGYPKNKKNKIFFGLFFNEIVLIKKVGFLIC